MVNNVYKSFEEVEEYIKQKAPKTLYKYRSDWTNRNHKELITKQLLWFAAPRELDDPEDIRTPIRIDLAEIETPEFYNKLKDAIKIVYPDLSDKEKDLDVFCINKLAEIKQNPLLYFEKNYKDIREGQIFDRVGLFSCSSDELNQKLWKEYGNNHAGFVVGFHTLELAKDLQGGMGKVTYSDIIPRYSFINATKDDDMDPFFLKKIKWDYQKEFRFFTIEDNDKNVRAKKYSVNSASEFIMGYNFPEKDKDEFISEIRKVFSKTIPVYQLEKVNTEIGFKKNLID